MYVCTTNTNLMATVRRQFKLLDDYQGTIHHSAQGLQLCMYAWTAHTNLMASILCVGTQSDSLALDWSTWCVD